MKTWVRRSINVGVLSAGFLLVGGAAAQADAMPAGNFGIGNGNDLSSVLQVPVDVCGNSVSVSGASVAGCEGGATANNEGTTEHASGPNFGLLNGNSVHSVVQAPVDVSGNALSVLGFSAAGSTGGATANNGGGGDMESARSTERTWGFASANGMGGGNFGIGNGNSVHSVVQAPIDLCGNAISLSGAALAGCEGGATANNGTEAATESGFNFGILNGNDVTNVVQVPVNVCGNSIAVIGAAVAGCDGGAWANNGGEDPDTDMPDDDGDGNDSGDPDPYAGPAGDDYTSTTPAAASGTVSAAKAAKAAKVAKNAKAGKAKAARHAGEGTRKAAASGARSHAATGMADDDSDDTMGGGWGFSGNYGILNGNDISSVVQIPVSISGNALSVLGFAAAGSTGGAWANN